MRDRVLLTCAVVFLSLTTVGCKLKLDAKMKGFKTGETDVVIVHVISEEGASLVCAGCPEKVTVPAGGEIDIEVKIPRDEKEKKVTLFGTKGSRKEGQIVLDFEKDLPPNVAMSKNFGSLSCLPRKCDGFVQLFPTPTFSMTNVIPGLQVQIGSDKFTADKEYVTGPLKSGTISPPFEKRLLLDVCTGKTEDPVPLVSFDVTVTFPDGNKGTTKASFDRSVLQSALSSMLYKASKGPVVFPWEKPGTPATGKRAAVYVYGGTCYDAGHSGASIADIDVVAISETKDRVDQCQHKLVGEKTGKTIEKSGKITMRDAQATAYDRITGKVLGTKLFQAPKACGKDIRLYSESEKIDDVTTSAEPEQIGAWAATFAK